MSSQRTYGIFWLAALLVAAFTPWERPCAQSPENNKPGRPRIGLVLSGGAAYGIAHVGVIKALEELRIPVDCVAGCSMGAIVGGLYACGLSPDEIDHWFRSADWHVMLSDAQPRESESIRAKQRAFDANQGIAFDVSREAQLKLPRGLTSGRNVKASLRSLTVEMRNVHDFDLLPIPFRCVATDIETGDMVILKQGDLVDSLRASSSLPAIFTPVKIDGRMLVDGGLANNLPISIAKQMGADVLIVIDTSEVLKKEEELDTAGAMASQMLAIFTKYQTKPEMAKLEAHDTYLHLKVPNMASSEFVKSPQAIDAGYEQTMQQQAALSRYSVGPEAYREFLKQQRHERDQPLLVRRLRVQTPDGEFVHELDEPVEFEFREREQRIQLQNLVSDLGEFQKYDVADYELTGGPGDYGLIVKAKNKKIGPSELTFGFVFDYSSADVSGFNLLIKQRMRELNRLGAEWTNYLSLGTATGFMTEWYQPLDRDRRFFVAPEGGYATDFVEGRDGDGNPLRFRQTDMTAGLDLGMRLGQQAELRVGLARGKTRMSHRLGPVEDLPSTSDLGWGHAGLVVDTLDASNFATRGTYAHVELIASREELGAEVNYTRLQGQWYAPLTFGKNTIVPRVMAAVKVDGEDVPIYDQFALGGFLNLSGLSRGSLFGENVALAEVVYYRKLADLNPGLGRAIYAGLSVELGEVWSGSSDFSVENATFAGSLFLGMDTVLGGVYLGVGVAERGDAAVYLQLGSLFGQGKTGRGFTSGH